MVAYLRPWVVVLRAWLRVRSNHASRALKPDRDDVSAVHPPLGDGRLECGVGARTRSDSRSDRRFGCLSSGMSTEPAHRLARTGRANVTS